MLHNFVFVAGKKFGKKKTFEMQFFYGSDNGARLDNVQPAKS
jgi:hypothetical protein